MRKDEIHKKAQELFLCTDSHVAAALSLLVLAVTAVTPSEKEGSPFEEGVSHRVADTPLNTESTFWVSLIGCPVRKLEEQPDGLWKVLVQTRDGKWWPHDGVRRERFVRE